MTRRVVAQCDETLGARVTRSWSLHYASGADLDLDRPGHVRAGSSLTWAGARLAVVQDDANFVALIDPADRHATAIALPRGAGGRRQFDDRLANKADKLDLEAVLSVPQPDGSPLLVAIGSGSSPLRESIVTLRGLDGPGDSVVVVHNAPALYAELRATSAFAGSELNIEGAVYLAGRLRLFNRGNGAARANARLVDATGDLDWRELVAHLENPDVVGPPVLSDVVQFDLGALGGVPLTFTDATLGPNDPAGATRHVLYSATAEASPDAIRDGPVTGSAVGVIVEAPLGMTARWTILRDVQDVALAAKVEGIVLHETDRSRAYAVIDCDTYDTPSELWEIELRGPWFDRG